MINGVINVYKEAGFTSHDVVAKLRGILHQKKIGHTGTLDPDAVGVLPVCLGKATKLVETLSAGTKTYETVLLLGRETDTQDVSGSILAEKEVHCTEQDVRTCLAGFLGEQEQIPPMYSAKKQNGKRLYQLARDGVVVDRKPTQIRIDKLELLSCSLPDAEPKQLFSGFPNDEPKQLSTGLPGAEPQAGEKAEKPDLPRVRMRITCSKGTYIRTLCHDIGQKLGCGGCMEQLTRTRVGIFEIENAVTLREIEEHAHTGDISGILIGIDSFFTDLPEVHVPENIDGLLHNGNPISYRDTMGKPDVAASKDDAGKSDTVHMRSSIGLNKENGQGLSAKGNSEGLTAEGNNRCLSMEGNRLRIYDSKGLFMGVYQYKKGTGLYYPELFFYDPENCV